MKIFFALLLIIFLAFSGYHLTFRHFRLPLFARKFYLTGTEFLFLGLLLGPRFLNVIDPLTCKGLEPFSTFLLGGVGLLFGLQFEIRKLRRFPIEFFIGSVSEGLFTFVTVLSGLCIMFSYLWPAPVPFAAYLTLAAAASCTAPTGLALMKAASVARHQHTVKLLQYISSIDGMTALLIFGLAFFFRPSFCTSPTSLWALGRGVIITLGASAGFIFLFSLYLSLHRDESELILMVLGMILLIGGSATMFSFSPLLINFLVGLCLVNLSGERGRLLNLLIRIEKPLYLLLLIFLGVGWAPDALWLTLGAGGYCLLRAVGKLMGGYLVTRMGSGMNHYPSSLGLGLLSPGGLPLAILLDFQKGFAQESTSAMISLALIAVIYNDLLSPHLLKQLLLKEGENHGTA